MPFCPKPLLALDTGVGASACLLLADGRVSSASMQTPRAHSRELLPLLKGLLDAQKIGWQALQAFAVGVGPGSFTGLRVACATIAGLNASLKKPVYRLSSLEITARQAECDAPFWAIEDARSGLVYAAEFYRRRCVSEPQCLRWQDFINLNPQYYISLSDVPVTLAAKALPVVQSREQALIEAASAIMADDSHAHWVEPAYLQLSQAEKRQ